MESLGLPKHPESMNIARPNLHCQLNPRILLGKSNTWRQVVYKCLLVHRSRLVRRLLLGLDFQKQHKSVIFHHGGPQSPLKVCGLSVLKVEPPDLFANLTSDGHTIAIKSRRYNHVDRELIDTEVQCLLKECIIESRTLLGKLK